MWVDEDSQAQSRTRSRVMLTVKDVWIFLKGAIVIANSWHVDNPAKPVDFKKVFVVTTKVCGKMYAQQ